MINSVTDRTTVSISRCRGYETAAVYAAVRQSLEPLGGMGGFVREGSRVLIKPNLLNRRGPEFAVTTHPEVVRAVIRLVRESGGVPVVGDSPGGSITNTEPVRVLQNIASLWEVTGMKKVCGEEGAELVSFEKGGYKTRQVPGKRRIPVLHIAKNAFDCDLLINLPKLKTHNLTLMTCAVKNLFGCIPGINKMRYHLHAIRTDEFSEMLVDIFEIIKPALNIVDAVRSMDGSGPNSGRVVDSGIIVSGTDAVAVDSVCSRILKFSPEEIFTCRIAAERGLGQMDPGKIDIRGVPLSEAIIQDAKKPAFPAGILTAAPRFVSDIVRPLIWTHPFIDNSKCTVCRDCIRNCPAGAISMKGKYPFVDRKKCIACMCCNELCRHDAIPVKHSLLLNLMHFAGSIARRILK